MKKFKLHSFVLALLLSFSSYAVERVYINNSSGIELEGFYHFPEDRENAKAIVMVIGGSGFTKGGFGGPSGLARVLADRGYIAFEWNKRGLRTNTEYNDIVKNLDVYESASIDNIYKDAEDILVQLKQKHHELDLFIVGGSEGSVITTLLAENHPEKIKAASTFGTVVNHFVDSMVYQITDGLIKEVYRFDQDGDELLTGAELKTAMKESPQANAAIRALEIPLADIDIFRDYRIEKNELRYAIGNKFLLNSPGYFLMTSGLPDSYLPSIFKVEPLYNRIQNIEVPIAFLHGSADWNTPVDKVLSLELVAKTFDLDHFEFKYYAGVGHFPSPDMFDDIIEFFETI